MKNKLLTILLFMLGVFAFSNAFANLNKDNGCFIDSQLRVIGANAYFLANHSDLSGFGYFPAKLFAGKALPFFMSCYSFNIYPNETKVEHFPEFYPLSDTEKIKQGYNLISKMCLPKNYDYVSKDNAILVNSYVVYKSFAFYKKKLGQCDLYFQFSHNCLSVYAKSSNQDKISCYWDNAAKTIIIKAR